jgi:hypothetical protein
MQRADVFIVHLWTAGESQGAFRAAVQRAGTDESAWFTEAATLVRYFEEQANADTGETSGAG